ncbi:MAG: hypothetical protein WBQ34_09655 [Candidatus Acidiferrales bacterium]
MARKVGVLIGFVCLFLMCGGIAGAQSVSGYIAGGTAIDSSAGPLNTFGAGTIYQTPSMGGTFETIGGDFVFFHGLGIGAEKSDRRGKGAYAGLEYAPSFFDVNAVYRPWIFTRRIRPDFQAGYGRADLNLYLTPQICITLPQGCGASNAVTTSVSDSQIHLAWGVRVYPYRGLFVKPQMDLRHVPNNFSSYFGSSWITQYSVAIGYTFDLSKWLGWGK